MKDSLRKQDWIIWINGMIFIRAHEEKNVE